MKQINYSQIVNSVRDMCIDSAYNLPADVKDALSKSLETETYDKAKNILSQLIENADIAATGKLPLCQDTGLAIIFVQQGNKTVFEPDAANPDATIYDAINEGVEQGYRDGYLRKSVVSEPLKTRTNTGTNTPAVIHYEIVPGEKLSITLMTKGGGCENKSMFKMFNPTESRETIIDWVTDVVIQAGANACPPFVVGVGIGGDFEQCCLISKKALLRNLNEPHNDSYYAEMERLILDRVNSTGIGPQGFGGDTTALGVKIETAPCHIASLPVAVNIECHSHRHKRVVI